MDKSIKNSSRSSSKSRNGKLVSKGNKKNKPKNTKGKGFPKSKISGDKKSPFSKNKSPERDNDNRFDEGNKKNKPKNTKEKSFSKSNISSDKKSSFSKNKSSERDNKSRFNEGNKIKVENRKRNYSKENSENKISGDIRLNKYISNSGICSRREADNIISTGVVQVNGKVVTTLGTKVKIGDIVKFDNQIINPEKKEYVLLNKPKNFITTLKDEKGRRTVMELVEKSTSSRLYPVGRLDRNTTGLLLFTNDGEMAKKLMHPKYKIRKIYHVKLNINLKTEHFRSIESGIKIDNWTIHVDEISYIAGRPKSEIGIEIHSGQNRIVRRIFENFGYDVIGLDRVNYASLTKKDLPRGRYRHLSQMEVNNLQKL